MKINISEILGKRTLIVGDVGKGKTRVTAEIVTQLISMGYEREITIIDMAPKRIGSIGGRIADYVKLLNTIKYLYSDKIIPPRTMGKNKNEVLRYAQNNRMVIHDMLQSYLNEPTRILIINDITLYFHAGSLEDILLCVRKAETFLANGYYGTYFSDDKSSGISTREKRLMEELMEKMDKIYYL